MICKKCNSMNPDDASICISCGAELEKGKKNIGKFKKIDKKKSQKFPSRNRMHFKMNDKLVLFILMAVLIFGFYLMNNNGNTVDFSNALNLVNKIKKSNDLRDTLSSFNDSLEMAKVKQIEEDLKKKAIQSKRKKGYKSIKKEKVFQTYISSKDSMEMILIPSGVVVIGRNEGKENEKFAHKVSLKSFYIDEHEVTNKQYRKFIEETGYKTSKYLTHLRFNAPNQPAVGISFNDAKAYANWAGKRLPTEEEWEMAAQGGNKLSIFATGKSISHKLACYNLNSKTDNPADVKSYSPNQYKLYDMSGNISEWTSSLPKSYSSKKFLTNYDSTYRVLRGGSWKSQKSELTIFNRKIRGIEWSDSGIGFRCVLDN